MKKANEVGNSFAESDEYKQYLKDVDNFWNEKDGQ
jgi:hypothetical protein